MSPTQKPTPEEKLFAVIQGAKASSPRARAQVFSLAAVSTQVKALVGTMDLPRVNQALTVVIVALGLWCSISPFVMSPQLDRVTHRATQRITPFVIPPPLEGLKSSEAYLQLTRAQDPFRVGEATPVNPTSPQAPPPPPPSAQQLLSDLRLVGIALGPEPRVMIEQLSQHTTHVLKVGDPIGNFTVKEILSDRAVLKTGDQELELF